MVTKLYNDLQKSAVVYKAIQWFTEVCSGLQSYTMVYRSLQWFTKLYNGLQKSATVDLANVYTVFFKISNCLQSTIHVQYVSGLTQMFV